MALEAARVATNRVLMDKLINDYLMQVHPYPHIILRENKMIFGAHADRLQQGMRRSFGKAIGTAARVEPDQVLITVKVKANAVETAKESLKRGSAKLPLPCKIVVEKLQSPDTQRQGGDGDGLSGAKKDLVIWFDKLRKTDVPVVGGKNC